MLPIVFEWQWDVGHMVFMGLFYGALTVIGLTIAGTIYKTIKDLYSGHVHAHEDDEH